MERLWTPWRMEYMGTAGKSDGCVFCDSLALGDDEAAFIIHRGSTAFVILNAFPYNTGHLMVTPNRHVGDVIDLDPDERHELFDVACLALEVVRDAMAPEGFNTGMNLGHAGGAGIPGHVHMHVVPRWVGDTNFMPLVGNTKVLPETLADTAAKLRPGFASA